MEFKGDVISTKLFNLQPVGLNTELVESLTSYISRLAEAHYVSVGTLIGKEIAPLLGKIYLVNSGKNGGSRFYEYGIELNGLGMQAEDIAHCLSSLTGVKTLRSLTLLPLQNVLQIKGIFRRCKAWCPNCLEEWKSKNQQIYEPLIWNFKAVKICGIHGISLKEQCPNCKKEVPVFSRKSRNGYCSFCGCWLGYTSVYISEYMGEEQLLWERYIFKSVGSLLKLGNESIERPTDISIHMFIKSIINEVGGVTAFSKQFNIPMTTVRNWFDKSHKPSLYPLLDTCFQIGIDITKAISSSQQNINLLPKHNSLNNPRENKPICVVQKRRNIDWGSIEAKLEHFVDCKFCSAISVNEIAIKLGYNKRLLYFHFPELCKKISERHASYVDMIKKERIAQGCREVSEAIVTLYNSGVYPSRRRIEKFLSQKILLREKPFQIAWKETLAKLGLGKMQNK